MNNAPAQEKVKTSISIPSYIIDDFEFNYRIIMNYLDGYLLEFKSDKPRRDRSREYNRGKGTTEHRNVYWSIHDYNRLHHVASALRISVSFLLYQILLFILSGGEHQIILSNSTFTVVKWSEECFEFHEKLVFRPIYHLMPYELHSS